jgi:DNA-binding transcriptional LysR family regulator
MEIDTRISLKKLELFCLVADLGSIKNAADQLFVTQPVVTAHIRSLNERLGVQLLYRDRNRMLLTEAGEVVYAWAGKILQETRDLDARLSGLTEGAMGTARVSASISLGSYVLPDLISSFRAERPQVLVTLSISDPEHAAQAVDTGEADFGVVIAAEDMSLTPGVEAETIGYEELVLVGAPSVDLPTMLESPTKLRGLKFMASPRDLQRQQIVERQLRQHGVRDLNIVAELGHAEAMKRMIINGDGVGFLYRCSIQAELERGELREIPVAGLEMSAPVLLLRRTERPVSRVTYELAQAVKLGIAARTVSDPLATSGQL